MITTKQGTETKTGTVILSIPSQISPKMQMFKIIEFNGVKHDIDVIITTKITDDIKSRLMVINGTLNLKEGSRVVSASLFLPEMPFNISKEYADVVLKIGSVELKGEIWKHDYNLLWNIIDFS